MIIFYNESDRAYENQPYKDDLNKLIKSNKVVYSSRQVLRQCFILLHDEFVANTNTDNLINMEKPLIISDKRHKIIFGDRDLNPIGWKLPDDINNVKDKDIFVITLNNTINSHFQLLRNSGYYILEYSVSHGEFSVIFARDADLRDKPVEFELIDLDTGISIRYSIKLSNGSLEYSKSNTSIDKNYTLYRLRKFRPAFPTRYIVTYDKNSLINDKTIRLSYHDILEYKDDNDVDDIIKYIKGDDIKAVTFYGKATDDNEEIRNKLKNSFRIYYEMYASIVNKVKIN